MPIYFYFYHSCRTTKTDRNTKLIEIDYDRMIDENLFDHIQRLKDALIRSVLSLVSDAESVAVPFSGGLDSSIIAHIAKEHVGVNLYTTGLEGASDLGAAKSAAELLELPLNTLMIQEVELVEAIPTVVSLIKTVNPVRVSISLPLFIVAESCREKILLVGQGADELYAGYFRYVEMDCDTLRSELVKDIKDVKAKWILNDKRLANYFGKELRTPYLEKHLIDASQDIPVGYKIYKGVRKYILRELAREIGLPDEIVNRPKKAIQYGTGVMKALKRLARKRGVELTDLLAECSVSGAVEKGDT